LTATTDRRGIVQVLINFARIEQNALKHPFHILDLFKKITIRRVHVAICTRKMCSGVREAKNEPSSNILLRTA